MSKRLKYLPVLGSVSHQKLVKAFHLLISHPVGSCLRYPERVRRRRDDRLSCPVCRQSRSQRKHWYQLAKIYSKLAKPVDFPGWAYPAGDYSRHLQERRNCVLDQRHIGQPDIVALKMWIFMIVEFFLPHTMHDMYFYQTQMSYFLWPLECMHRLC